MFTYDPLSGSNAKLEENVKAQCYLSNQTECVAKQEGQRRKQYEQLPYLILLEITTVWLENPMQPDEASCGIMIIAQMYAFVAPIKLYQPFHLGHALDQLTIYILEVILAHGEISSTTR